MGSWVSPKCEGSEGAAMPVRPGVIKTSFRSDRAILDAPGRKLWAVAGAALALVMPALVANATINQFNFILLGILGAVALNVLMGIGGQVSIGNAALLAVGGFTAGLLTRNTDRPFLLV